MAGIISCDVKYQGPVTAATPATLRAINDSLRQAWQAVGWRVFERFVEKHFTKAGAEEYRHDNVAGDGPVYAPRAGEDETGKAFWRSYTGRKQKALGHTLAMVFSGRTRDGAKRATIYASPNGVTIKLPGAVHLNYYKPPAKKYGPHAGEPSLDLRRDLLAISRREAAELAELHRAEVIRAWGHEQIADQIFHIA